MSKGLSKKAGNSCRECLEGDSMSFIKLEDVTKVYDTGEAQMTALKGVGLEIEKRTFISFIGPSGSGKTTLLNLIGCLDKPTTGTVLVNSIDIGTIFRFNN